jgi:hypothetical protein
MDERFCVVSGRLQTRIAGTDGLLGPAFAVLGAVARRRGLRATYPELLAPHGSIEPDPSALAAAGLT